MARSRNIKPGFFTNAELLECQPLARLLFAGLWTEADCRGILEDRPKHLKIKLLPADNCNVDELLAELEQNGFIARYEADGVRCISVLQFCKHQNPHQNEKPNSLPAPEWHRTSTVLVPEQNKSDPADSLLLIPDSLKPTDVGAAPVQALPRNGRAQQIVATWYEMAGGMPVNYQKAVGLGQTLANHGATDDDIRALYRWLSDDPFFGNKFDLGTGVSQWEKFQQSRKQRQPKPLPLP